MDLNLFLEKIKVFIDTGDLDIRGKECHVPNLISRLAIAWSLFEREKYKHLGSLTYRQEADFCSVFSQALFSFSSSEFEQAVSSLDFRSKEFLLKGIESSLNYSDLDFSGYSRFL